MKLRRTVLYYATARRHRCHLFVSVSDPGRASGSVTSNFQRGKHHKREIRSFARRVSEWSTTRLTELAGRRAKTFHREFRSHPATCVDGFRRGDLKPWTPLRSPLAVPGAFARGIFGFTE